jgi:hypothetical protein
MANRDPIVDMSPAQKAWFEDQAIKVDGFEPTDCPHGRLMNVMQHNRTDWTFKCTECAAEFNCRLPDE